MLLLLLGSHTSYLLRNDDDEHTDESTSSTPSYLFFSFSHAILQISVERFAFLGFCVSDFAFFFFETTQHTTSKRVSERERDTHTQMKPYIAKQRRHSLTVPASRMAHAMKVQQYNTVHAL